MKRSSTPQPLSAQDGPFRYTYLSVIAIPGMRPPGDAERAQICAFPALGSVAFLTPECDTYCSHMDRSAAISYLLLTGFRGRDRFRWLSVRSHQLLVRVHGAEKVFRRNLAREMAAARERRRESHGNPGCYLVYQADGDLIEPARFDAARRFAGIGFGFDIVRAAPYRELHRQACHGTATALSLALVETNGSPETHVIGDIVYLTGKDQLIVYPKTIEMGAVGITVSSSFTQQILESANSYIPGMINESSIETSISLFVESQKKENDNLRSFIAAWSALELLVNRLAKVTRPDWQRVLEAQVLPDWDKDLKEVPYEEYRLRDRFFAVACVLNPDSASSDAATFVRVNTLRSGFYHRMEVRDKDLPTNDVQMLFRRYLKWCLSHQVQRAD